MGPVDYADYVRRQNARDPAPKLADVFERSNLAALPSPARDGAPADAFGGKSAQPCSRASAASQAASAERSNEVSRRLYDAPRLGDVSHTPSPAACAPGTSAASPATIIRGRLVDVFA